MLGAFRIANSLVHAVAGKAPAFDSFEFSSLALTQRGDTACVSLSRKSWPAERSLSRRFGPSQSANGPEFTALHRLLSLHTEGAVRRKDRQQQALQFWADAGCARTFGVPPRRINETIHGKRAIRCGSAGFSARRSDFVNLQTMFTAIPQRVSKSAGNCFRVRRTENGQNGDGRRAVRWTIFVAKE
jgi:hypothetical protein